MDVYKRQAKSYIENQISKLSKSGSGQISVKAYSDKLKVFQKVFTETDKGLQKLGIDYWKDRADFVKDDVMKLRKELLESVVSAFKSR